MAGAVIRISAGQLGQHGASADSARFLETVTAKTSAYTVTAADNGTVFTDEGASVGVTFTLPSASAGLHFTFVNTINPALTVSRAGTDTINVGLTSGTSVASASTGNGGALRLIAAASGRWFALTELGTWTVT